VPATRRSQWRSISAAIGWLAVALIDIADDRVMPSYRLLGGVAYWIAQCAASLADYPRAESAFLRAMGSFDAAIAEAPEDPAAFRRKGICCNAFGGLLTRLGRYEEARNTFELGA
jgi:tetratricopeptide (TPR) repeat protein